MKSIEVFVINLDHNKERLHKFTNYYANSDIKNLHIQKLSAINGKQLDLDYIKSIMSDDAYKGLLHI